MSNKKQNRWTNEEMGLLLSCMYKEMTYDDLVPLFPLKNKKEIISKCEINKLGKGFRKSKGWQEYELDILKENYPLMPNEEILKILPHRTKKSIYAKAKELKLEKSYEWRPKNLSEYAEAKWNKDKDEELASIFLNNNEQYCYKYFNEKYKFSKSYLKDKMLKLNLIKPSNYDICNNANLNDAFIIYKACLQGEIKSLGKYAKNINKYNLIILYKYYNRFKHIEVTKEYFINNTIGTLLMKSMLKSLIKNRFDSYFEFITMCYPTLGIKEWELKKLNVPDDYWNNKYNRYWCIRDGIKKLINDNIIKNSCEALELDNNIIKNYLNPTLISVYGKQAIREYFDFINSEYNTTKIFNGIRFDSFEEKYVYKYIYENFTKNIFKCTRTKNLYKNPKNDENYIPDFYIPTNNGGVVIIEYFGMMRLNSSHKIFENYYHKMKRKIEFFKSLNDVKFIDLYPSDIRNNYEGVKNKLTPFFGCDNKCERW